MSPEPGSITALPATQISFLNVDPSAIGTVTVVGSSSGSHAGTLEAYSQGDGASFVPKVLFTAGETVTVTTDLVIVGASSGTFQFTIATEAPGAPVFNGPAPERGAEIGTATASGRRAATASRTATAPSATGPYPSDPSLDPPSITVNLSASGGAPGDALLAPSNTVATSLQRGPMIVDQKGQLVWFDPVTVAAETARALRVQSWNAKRVLTFWQGDMVGAYGVGLNVVVNTEYQTVATVQAGNGLYADGHEFVLTTSGTAWVEAYDPLEWNLTAVGGPADGVAFDSVMQEIDVKTGLVVFEWSALDHVPLSASYLAVSSGDTSAKGAYNWFHLNSIDPARPGQVIISARNTHQIYDISTVTHQILWQIGGMNSSFSMGPGTEFVCQHDAQLYQNDELSLFDDESGMPRSSPARGLVLQLDMKTMTATLVYQFIRNPPLQVPNDGDMQRLSDGNYFVGWGGTRGMTEFLPSGQEVFDASLPSGWLSYRDYLATWTGNPLTRPSAAALPGAGGVDTVYMSWNGATKVTSWEVLDGSAAAHLQKVSLVARSGFETKVSVPSADYFEVEALNQAGTVMSKSAVVQPTAS